MQAVKEVESGQGCAWAVSRKRDITGTNTGPRWVWQLGSGRYGKPIRVAKSDAVNEAARLRLPLRQAMEALADAPMELALEKAFLAEAGEQMDQTVEGFKKSKRAGARDSQLKVTLVCHGIGPAPG
jgi:hypothetical protein